MTNQPTEPNVSEIGDAARPPVADRAAFQTELDRLRARERPIPARAMRSPPPDDASRWSKSIHRLR
jgi:hypothetical protein